MPSHFPIAMNLLTNCDGTATLHWSGPPPRTRNFLKEHMMHEYFSKHARGVLFENFFIYFFLGFRRPNIITGLSGWRTPDYPLETQEPVPDWRTGAFPSLW